MQDLKSKLTEAQAIGANDQQIQELQTRLQNAEQDESSASDSLSKATAALHQAHNSALEAQKKAVQRGLDYAGQEIATYQRGLAIAQKLLQPPPGS